MTIARASYFVTVQVPDATHLFTRFRQLANTAYTPNTPGFAAKVRRPSRAAPQGPHLNAYPILTVICSRRIPVRRSLLSGGPRYRWREVDRVEAGRDDRSRDGIGAAIGDVGSDLGPLTGQAWTKTAPAIFLIGGGRRSQPTPFCYKLRNTIGR